LLTACPHEKYLRQLETGKLTIEEIAENLVSYKRPEMTDIFMRRHGAHDRGFCVGTKPKKGFGRKSWF